MIREPVAGTHSFPSILNRLRSAAQCDGQHSMPSVDWKHSYGFYWRFGTLDLFYLQLLSLSSSISGYNPRTLRGWVSCSGYSRYRSSVRANYANRSHKKDWSALLHRLKTDDRSGFS